MFLVYGGLEDDLVVNGYTDASFQSDKDDFRSQSGYVFCLNGGAVSWKSSKQSTVADSIMLLIHLLSLYHKQSMIVMLGS